MGQVRLATKEEVNLYGGVFPLYGFVSVRGLNCAVKDLRPYTSPEDPNWEIRAPRGYRFPGGPDHVLFGESQEEVILMALRNGLEVCEVDCTCERGAISWMTYEL